MVSDPIKLQPGSITLPENFEFRQVDHSPLAAAAPAPVPPPPPLGPLTAFAGTFTGTGFNTIFRPDNQISASSKKLPKPLNPGDNILELNLTSETLSFSRGLGSVPNRGLNQQADIFLNGVPYLQSINDVTTPGQTVGIHLEPGIWINVPATTQPQVGPTVARMASIPHGTTIEAQGVFFTVAGPPQIAPVDITPFAAPANGILPPPASLNRIKFPSQTAANNNTARIPQDLSSFIAAGTITQAILDDPNTVLRNAINGQTITSTTVIVISTQPLSQPVINGLPQFGGGTDNIAFLLGDGTTPLPQAPNAQAIQMTATFWIETVEYTIVVPPFPPHVHTMHVKPHPQSPGQPVPTFAVPAPPAPKTAPTTLKVHGTQLQYTQLVLLNFATLFWPHVSVATLVPAAPVHLPPSVWK